MRRFLASLTACVAISLAAVGTAAAGESLPLDRTIERAIKPGASIEWTLRAPAAAALLLTVDEIGVDVDVSVAEGGVTLRSFDGDILRYGRHRIAFRSTADSDAIVRVTASRPGTSDGSVRISVRKQDGTALDIRETELIQRYYDPQQIRSEPYAADVRGLLAERLSARDEAGAARTYLLLDRIFAAQSKRTDAIAVLTESLPVFRRLGDRRGEAGALNNIAMHHWRLGDGRLAAPFLGSALALAKQLHDSLLEAVVQNNLCLTTISRESVQAATRCFERTLALSLAAGDEARIATAYNNLGGAYSNQGRTLEAASAFERAVRHREQFLHGKDLGDPLGNLGLERQAEGNLDEAAALFVRAEHAYLEAKDERGLSVALRHRGQLALLQGDYTKAISLLQEAAAIQRRIGRKDDLIATLARLGEAQRLREGGASVPPALVEAMNLAEVDGDSRALCDALLRLARAQVDANQPDAALALTARAEALASHLNDTELRAEALLEHARTRLAMNDNENAAAAASAALAALPKPSHPLRLADTLSVQAQALFQLGRYAEAAATFQRGADAAEKAKYSEYDPEKRARFFATQRALHEGYAASLAELALADGNANTVSHALRVSDFYRSRALLEHLASPSLAAQKPGSTTSGGNVSISLQRRAAALAARRWSAAELGMTPDLLRTIDAELQSVSREIDEAKSALPASRRVRDSASSRDDVRLDASVTLVHFLLTPSRGYAWVQSRDGLSLHQIAGNIEIGAKAERARAALADNADEAVQAHALSELCAAVWQPIEAQVRDERVAIVADGSLHGVPWAALRCTDPGDPESHFLVESHEFTLVPSIAFLASGKEMREDGAVLAVVDPVYSGDDARMHGLHRNQSAQVESPYPRLTRTASEALSLQRIAGPARTMVLDGVSANRERVLAALSGHHAIVHFGTHGVSNRQELSGNGLLLSLYDASGSLQNGLIGAQELARMKLDTDVVVLAACESARGVAIADEAPLGVEYAFLAAGVRNVLATSWPISDWVAGEWMQAYYGALLEQHLSAAAALRRTQLAFLKESAWRKPGYWAGFAVYGALAHNDPTTIAAKTSSISE